MPSSELAYDAKGSGRAGSGARAARVGAGEEQPRRPDRSRPEGAQGNRRQDSRHARQFHRHAPNLSGPP
eukprot:692135-Rhodomonas_salina.1